MKQMITLVPKAKTGECFLTFGKKIRIYAVDTVVVEYENEEPDLNKLENYNVVVRTNPHSLVSNLMSHIRVSDEIELDKDKHALLNAELEKDLMEVLEKYKGDLKEIQI